jgi:transcriptional regulator with XRE-family HTH domain
MGFYDRIKDLVKKSGITIETMLNSVFPDDDPEKLSLGSYNTLRKRGNLPRANQAARIAQYLNVSVEYLVFGTDAQKPDMTNVINKAEELLRELKNL